MARRLAALGGHSPHLLAMNQCNPFQPQTILGSMRRKIFISYHHGGDQAYYNLLSHKIHDQLDLVFDNSLDRQIDSGDPAYVIQRIRDSFIEGTSCTLVLCGALTSQRKYVDWEIKATLDKGHALIGIQLPTLVPGLQGTVQVPDRLRRNTVSGYAIWESWANLMANPAVLKGWIENALARDQAKIDNPAWIKQENG